MNLESLYDKIRQPQSLGADDIPALKELCVKYPYAQLFSVLYLKTLAQSKDLHFEDELQNHAYKITDRAKLFDLIQGNENSGPVEIQSIEESEEPEHVPAQPEPNPNNTIIPEPETETETEEKPAELSEKIEVPVVPEKEPVQPAPVAEEPEIEAESPQKPAIDELEKEILSGIMATAYSLDLEEKQRREQEKKEEVPAEEKIDLQERRSFTSWLKVASKNSEEPAKKEHDQLIEKFIREEPERIKPKAEFYSAPKKAKESVKEDKLIYTETLANIYALQGNFPKAITAFQQLMLTNPEKKLYFAKKIEELNKKINP